MKFLGLVALVATLFFGQGLALATQKDMVACHECHYHGHHGGHECCHERTEKLTARKCINYYEDDFYHGGHCDDHGWCHCD